MALWGGRFAGPTDEDLRALNDSIHFDRRMYREDIAGSQTWARALVGAGILTAAEAERIVQGLEQVLAEFEADGFELKPGDEDIHTAVERRLTEIVGPLGGKLHTGRSRNDQVATDFRLWCMGACQGIGGQLRELQAALVERAADHLDTLMPGFTHLQPAQPIVLAHWLLSYFWMLERDRGRLKAAHECAAVLPLGSGALAGTPLAVDRDAMAGELGFAAASQNSLDSVSDRDFVAETLFALALAGVHLSRLGEDIILYSNPLFGFFTLDDRYSTGSSLMPQKRNADPLELARGKAGRLIGNLTGLMTTLKGLPSAYNKDLQEDKEALFDSVDTMQSLLPVLTAVVHTLGINTERMLAALDEEMLATDLADYLVARGLPFREAHHAVGAAVRAAAEATLPLSQLPLSVLQSCHPLFGADVHEVFDFGKSARSRASAGGTAPAAVAVQLEAARATLAG